MLLDVFVVQGESKSWETGESCRQFTSLRDRSLSLVHWDRRLAMLFIEGFPKS